jgi:Bax protein
MTTPLQRLAEHLRALGRALRRIPEHPAWQRIGCAIAARLPEGTAGRLRAFQLQHPGAVRGAVACAAVVIVAMVWVSYDYVRVKQPGDRSLPDFRVIEDTSDRKAAFIEFLQPVVAYENARIRDQRRKLLAILDDLENGDEAAAHESAWLAKQADLYRARADTDLARARALARKIDIVPPSLALAQAALESAWGTSRFAREGNNLFGQWCFTAGCGIVPRRRPEQATYEVQAFDTIAESVRTYLANLNSHPAYSPMRRIRAQARDAGRKPTGLELAAGLVNYAAIGEDYVHHIRSVIRRNDLDELDEAA